MTAPVYIDPSIGSGGSGTSGSPYGSWAAFLTGQARNLTTEGECIVYIKGDAVASGTTQFLLTGFATSTTGYLHFQPWPGFEGDGTVNGTPGWRGRSGVSGSANPLVDFSGKNFCKITRLKIKNEGTGIEFGLNVGTNVTLEGVLCYSSERALAPGNTSTMSNCLFVHGSTGGVCVLSAGTFAAQTFLNCTAVSTVTGVNSTAFQSDTNSNLIAKNCAVYGSFTTEWQPNGTVWTAACTNNAGQLAAASQPTNINTGTYVRLTADPFVNFAGGNYAPSGTGLLNNAGATGVSTIDAKNVARAATPEIGYLEVSSTAVPIFSNHRRRR